MESSEISLKSLPLHDVLSAPLTAAVEAQQQASLGLLNFVRDVGFTGQEDRTPAVRLVEFRYAREGRDVEGKPVAFNTQLRIPLLAMVSLPHLEINSLNVNFLVGVQSVSVTEASPQLGISAELQERYPFLRGHSSLRVAPISRTAAKGATQSTGPYDLEISFAASSEEPTDGIQRILTALTGMMTEETE